MIDATWHNVTVLHYMHAHTLYALPDNYGANAYCNNSICKPTYALHCVLMKGSAKRVYDASSTNIAQTYVYILARYNLLKGNARFRAPPLFLLRV